MPGTPHLPAADEFPVGTEFTIYEFDLPLPTCWAGAGDAGPLVAR